MHIPSHLMSGWCVGASLPLTARERVACMMAATLADLDGISLAWGWEVYQRWHHVLAHNVFAGLLLAGGCSLLAQIAHRGRCFLVCLALFHLHLALDYYGSGLGWEIHYWWPLREEGYGTEQAWALSGWQNYVAMGLLLLWSVAVALWKGITPFELLTPGLEADWRRFCAKLRGLNRPSDAC
jgi:inner membrane protein